MRLLACSLESVFGESAADDFNRQTTPTRCAACWGGAKGERDARPGLAVTLLLVSSQRPLSALADTSPPLPLSGLAVFAALLLALIPAPAAP